MTLTEHIQAMRQRHDECQKLWLLDDEVLEGAIEFLKETFDDDSIIHLDPELAYDELAINAEIVDKDDAPELYNKCAEELAEDALFTTEHYIVLNW